jgi:hypothetical protein
MKLIQFILLFCCSNFIFGQTNTGNKGYAFYKAYLPGMQRLDENGNPETPRVTLERTIYLECKKTVKLKLVYVKYNQLTLKAILLKPAENKIVVGIKPTTGLPVVINARKGYIFWTLVLEPTLKIENAFGKSLNEISVKTIAGLKQIRFQLKKETELIAPETQ